MIDLVGILFIFGAAALGFRLGLFPFNARVAVLSFVSVCIAAIGMQSVEPMTKAFLIERFGPLTAAKIVVYVQVPLGLYIFCLVLGVVLKQIFNQELKSRD